MEVGSFLVPDGESSGYVIHGLNTVHDPGREPCWEVGDQGGGIFCLIIFGSGNVQFECVDVFLKLFTRIDVSGG